MNTITVKSEKQMLKSQPTFFLTEKTRHSKLELGRGTPLFLNNAAEKRINALLEWEGYIGSARNAWCPKPVLKTLRSGIFPISFHFLYEKYSLPPIRVILLTFPQERFHPDCSFYKRHHSPNSASVPSYVSAWNINLLKI